jgi:hypothetical protein
MKYNYLGYNMQSIIKVLTRLLICISASILIANACGNSNDAQVVKDFEKNLKLVKVIFHENGALIAEIRDLAKIIVHNEEKREFDDAFVLTFKQLSYKQTIYLEKAGHWQNELTKIKDFIDKNEYQLKRAGVDTQSAIYIISMALIQIRDSEKYLNSLKGEKLYDFK